jgi:hypothetical protein
MANTIPNLDKITKENPKMGEAVKKLQDISNAGVTDTRVKLPANPAFDPSRSR